MPLRFAHPLQIHLIKLHATKKHFIFFNTAECLEYVAVLLEQFGEGMQRRGGAGVHLTTQRHPRWDLGGECTTRSGGGTGAWAEQPAKHAEQVVPRNGVGTGKWTIHNNVAPPNGHGEVVFLTVFPPCAKPLKTTSAMWGIVLSHLCDGCPDPPTGTPNVQCCGGGEGVPHKGWSGTLAVKASCRTSPIMPLSSTPASHKDLSQLSQ